MSRKSLGRSLLDILKQLGAPIDKQAELAVASERDAHPDDSTQDIVHRLSLAPPELVEKAVEIAKQEGSTEVLKDRMKENKVETRDQAAAAASLADAAAEIARKT